MQFAHLHILGMATPKRKGQDSDPDCHSVGSILDLGLSLVFSPLVLNNSSQVSLPCISPPHKC